MNEATATLGYSSAVAGATEAPRIYPALNEEPVGRPPRKLRHSVGPQKTTVVVAAQPAEQSDSPGEATDQCGSQREVPTERPSDRLR